MAILISQNQNRLAGAGTSRLRSGGIERRRGFLAFTLGSLWLLLGLAAVRSQEVSHEYPLKAVFLLNFAQFTEWPTNAFDSPDAPFVIGVLGTDPFGPMLEEAVRGERVSGRSFVVEHYRRLEEVKTCHILFISQSEAPHLGKILNALSTRPILTVSDIEKSAARGVCVRFLKENNKIRLRINLDSVRKAGLVMSSKLLRVADAVPPKQP